jgi:AsmA protein
MGAGKGCRVFSEVVMRKVGFVIGIIAVLLIVAVLVFAATFNVNQYRGTIQAELEKRLNRRVALGDMHLRLFPPRLEVQNLSIADDPKFGGAKPFVEAQGLDLSVKLLPLLTKSVEISSLSLQQPRVELIKDAQGMWNFSTIGAPQKSVSSSNKQQISLGELAVQDGQVAITDQQARKPRMLYDHINLTVKDFARDSPFSFDASVHLPGQGAEEMRLAGKCGPVKQGDPAATSFHGSLDLKGVDMAGFKKFLQTSALANSDGILSGHTNIVSESGRLSAEGQITVDKLLVRGVEVGYPITVDYGVNDDLASELLRIDKGAVKLGQTPLYVTGTINMKLSPAQLDLNLRANNVSVAEIARLAATAGTALVPGATVNGTLNADIQARGPADNIVLSGTVTGRNIQASGKDIPQPVQVKAVNLTFTPDEIRSDNFPVVSGGTTVNTRFSLRNYASKSPLVDATLKAPQAELPAILAMAKAYGVSGSDKLNGAGTLSLDMHAAGTLQSITSDEIMRALNGTVNFNFNNVRYSGVDIGHQLASIGQFLNSAQSLQKDQGFTNILKMTGNVVVRNGMAQTNNLQASLDVANVGITGSANLVSQALNLDVMAVLAKSFSQQVGGSGIGGYMNTALANNQGEIVIPATVAGTFQHPVFGPNVQKIAQMKLKGLMPSADNPLGGASGILGNLLGQKNTNPPQGQPANTQPQPNPVDQLLDIFGKKKKQNNDLPPPESSG